ncbi:MAG: 50S ribosomal protein L19e [Nitrosopumilaceae archaeon]
MVVNLRAKKRLVSRIVGVGLHRVKFDNDHLDDIADAITRVNIRSLLTANTIKIKRIVGTSHGRATLKKIQRRKRGTKQGSKKGRKGARVGKKRVHITKVRALRHRLKVSKDRKEITNKEFWELYKMVGGNTIRNVAHLRSLIDEKVSKRKS